MTHEEEARLLLYSAYPERAIREALRKRDELYDAAWAECECSRLAWEKGALAFDSEQVATHFPDLPKKWGDAEHAHDTLRREAGKEKA